MNARTARVIEYLLLLIGAAALVATLVLVLGLVYAPGWVQLALQGRAYAFLGGAVVVWVACGAAFVWLPPACHWEGFRRKKRGAAGPSGPGGGGT